MCERKTINGEYWFYVPTFEYSNDNGWIKEDVLCVTMILKRPLKKYETIYHIDGNKQNNEPKNLAVFRTPIDLARYLMLGRDVELVRNDDRSYSAKRKRLPVCRSQLIELLNKKTIKQISDRFDVDISTIYRWIKRYQINLRQLANRRNKGTGYIGVVRVNGKYAARITVDKNRLHIGTFDTSILAAQAYDQFARYFFEDNAKCNFQERVEVIDVEVILAKRDKKR